jgi:hypothetical protein
VRCKNDQKIGAGPGKIGMLVFGVALVIRLVYAGGHLLSDLSQMHTTSVGPYILLGVALLIAPYRPGPAVSIGDRLRISESLWSFHPS